TRDAIVDFDIVRQCIEAGEKMIGAEEYAFQIESKRAVRMPRAIEVVDLDRIGERILVRRAESREVRRQRERMLIVDLADEVLGLIDGMLQVERDDFRAIGADLVRRAGEKQHIAG